MDDTNVTLEIIDTAGQEKFSDTINGTFLRGADCCGFCFDLTCRDSFHMMDKWMNNFQQYVDPDEDYPFILVGNKVDMQSER